MQNTKSISYEEFLKEYKANKIIVKVDRMKAGRFVESKEAGKRFKPAHYFWTYASFFLMFVLPIIMLFKFWVYAVLSFLGGIFLYQAVKKSAAGFVLENMLEDEKFWRFAVEKGGAILTDDENNLIMPAADLFSTKTEIEAPDIKDDDIVNKIKEVLDNHSIGYEEVREIFASPTIGTIGIKPAKQTKVKDIVELSDNFAVAMGIHPIRIDVPVVGTHYVGIQIPKKDKGVVKLKEELDNPEFKPEEGKLLVPLGRNIKNESVYINLFDEPHMIAGGATNSGKSNFIHSLILSAMKQYGPDKLRFIFADPKRVELTVYNGFPHLMAPVIMDYKKGYNAVRWCLDEIDRRFDRLSEAEVSNIREYNKLGKEVMPYIVFVIDEMADFSVSDSSGMFVDGLIRILQMARAVGVHLIMASARPCDETFPGMLRANLFSHLAFSTATAEDSKIILDQPGAEKLLGRGDALYVNSSRDNTLVRIQAPFVSDNEIMEAINSAREKYTESYFVLDQFPEDFKDPLFDEAKKLAISLGQISPAKLQRNLKIGYARAATLMDQLEEDGTIGPADGAKPREVINK